MRGDVNVFVKTQKIIVDPISNSVSIINAGPQGPAGKSSDDSDLAKAVTAHTSASADVAGYTVNSSLVINQAHVSIANGVPLPVWVGAAGYGHPINGPNIPPYSYMMNIAADRLSFDLSSNPLVFNAALALATGTVNLNVRPPNTHAHGLNLPYVLEADDLRSTVKGYSSSIAPTNVFAERERFEEKWYKGEKWIHSYEYPISERLFPPLDWIPQNQQILAAVGPTTSFDWTNVPTAAVEFLGELDTVTPMTVRHRFQLVLDDVTQFQLAVEVLLKAGTGTPPLNTRLYVQFFDTILATPAWSDLTLPRTNCPLIGTLGFGTESPWSPIVDNAQAIALASPSRSVPARIMGVSNTGTNQVIFGNVIGRTR